MKTIKVELDFYSVVHLMQADAAQLADAEKLSYADLLRRAERMARYPAMLAEAWGTGLGPG